MLVFAKSVVSNWGLVLRPEAREVSKLLVLSLQLADFLEFIGCDGELNTILLEEALCTSDVAAG